MGTRFLVLATILVASTSLLGQQSTGNAGTSHTAHVEGRGCIRPAEKEGCFVLHDIKRHRYYDLSFDAAGTKPDLYAHIWFEGIGYSHDAHCSQGRPVHVSSWKPLPGECSKSTAETKAK